jgi:hypothetical protein
VALKSRAEDLRRIARDLDFKYTESAVPENPEAIRFTFELTDEQTLARPDRSGSAGQARSCTVRGYRARTMASLSLHAKTAWVRPTATSNFVP